MSDKTTGKSIVPSRKLGLVPSGDGGNDLIRRVASDALIPMQSLKNQQRPILHRVGTREFHDEDFQQLQIWASDLGMEGRVADFVEAFDRYFRVLVSISDDFVIGHATPNRAEWCCDGRIRLFVGFGGGKFTSPRLPKLTHLALDPEYIMDLCAPQELMSIERYNSQLTELDLSAVPALTHLWCSSNRLTELDLSAVPALTHLWCHNNQLTELDLASVPALRELECGSNNSIDLDLSAVPALTYLGCGGNQLTELDLASVPALTSLYCAHNQLTELDLAFAPALTYLECDNNQLTELDIRRCLSLRSVTVDPWVVVHKRPEQTVRHRQ
jgi:hypothetical protein